MRGGDVVAGALLRGDAGRRSRCPPGEWRDVLGEGTVSGTLTLDGIALLRARQPRVARP